MSGQHTITLKPSNLSFKVEHGTPLQDVLFPYGVEFPCGGRKLCNGCKIRVLSGSLPVTPEEKELLSGEELSSGWRLACCGSANGDLEIEMAQWEASILTDDSSFLFVPQEGYGMAIDIGTTTIAGQLLDLSTGNVLSVTTALNKQAQYGADIMERINYAISQDRKTDLGIVLKSQIKSLVTELSDTAGIDNREIRNIVLVGNTAMQHFFCDFDIKPLSHVPFEPDTSAFRISERSPDLLGLELGSSSAIIFLPSLGGFVGSDILAGIVATGIYRRPTYSCLIDLGTNGEIVIGNMHRLLCASTAAGPAFEGARISMGMRAVTGAIAAVNENENGFTCTVIGGGSPRGICGSGLVDAVSVGLKLGHILPNGRLAGESKEWQLQHPVNLSQRDIRELQLAKGAIAAGISVLLDTMEITVDDIAEVYLAGAFGNYINHESARNIGLLPFPIQRIKPAGNTALLGAKRALFDTEYDNLQTIQNILEHIPLNRVPEFMDTFTQEMQFPEHI
jgi:uncharacterized 2Fe-2S/4Fe-4S cluster protein (DUF4445 family)